MSKERRKPEFVSITPNPRILRTLGDIPFELWQCIAEIMDNSFDAFARARASGVVIDQPRVDIHWSDDSVAAGDRNITVEDNAPGMELDAIQKAVRAGYSTNDPIRNLGLFGMGFNIATARMGDITHFWSTTAKADEWSGVRIDFDDLMKRDSFNVPVVHSEKGEPGTSGTRVVVQLKEEMYAALRKKKTSIRRQLEAIYTPILGQGGVAVYMMKEKLVPRPKCVWGKERAVMRGGEQVKAVQDIAHDLGDAHFDVDRGRYLSESEVETIEMAGQGLPENVVLRHRRLRGWLGIQRYNDPADFGIDLVRNGRKILIKDKSLFEWENPETGMLIPEYPVELGSTTGGRIVGELHVDYLVPTYQKNAFDKTDRSWRLTMEAIRGSGPLLPKRRREQGLDAENNSPLGKLVNAYRRNDPGTKCLAISKGTAKDFAKKFYKGDTAYQSDDEWFKAAQEEDRAASDKSKGKQAPDGGEVPSDDLSKYVPGSGIDTGGAKTDDAQELPGAPAPLLTSETEDLIQRSERQAGLTGSYAFGKHPEMEVTGWRLMNGQIKKDGQRVPCLLARESVQVDFFYDETHPILAEYPLSPRQLLLHFLAVQFWTRDMANVSVEGAFLGLVENHLEDERVNSQVLQERAHSIRDRLRDRMPALLGHRFSAVKEAIQSAGMEEGLVTRLIEEDSRLIDVYQNSGKDAAECLAFADEASIIFLVEKFPAEFLDGNFFHLPYEKVKIQDEEARRRVQKRSLNQALSYLSDVLSLLQGGPSDKARDERFRQLHTLSILERHIVDL